MLAVAEAVLFRDVEALVCNYLRPHFVPGMTVVPGPALALGMQVGIRIPNPRVPEFIRVLRTGGPKETLVSEAAQITVEAWAQTEYRASQLLSLCRALLNAADETIYGVREFSGPANLPDPLSAQSRYTQSFQVRARGTVINT
jgi:hypothetical protein